MKLNLFDGEYLVQFQHDTVNRFTTATLHKLVVENEGTEAEETIKQEIHTVESLCHWRDQFTKKTGRKVALAKLLAWMSNNRFMLTEEQRREIWEEYFKTHRK